jgi:hypothetical protein
MRTLEQINSIKAKISNPYVIENFLSFNDIDYLIKLFNSQETFENKVYKNTGPITLDIKPYSEDPVVSKIIYKLVKEIGPFDITAAFFFQTEFPHIIHNDDSFELPDNVYKAITLPLSMEGFAGEYPKLCFFNQFYFHGPSKFFNGDDSIPTYYNKQIYDYQDVSGLVDTPFDDNNNYFTHLKSQWLEGLSLHSTLDWIPGNALVFDSTRLHCASDFRTLGIRSKLGISIFTKRNNYV